MTYLNINLKFEELTEAVLKSDMNTLMKSLAITVFNAYMEEERHQFIQAAPHERSDQRQDYRNGYYERQWTLSIGTLKLQVPRTRSGEFKTELFERYQRNEQAFLLSMMEMVINGVSTRKVTKIVHELCGETVSKSFVSDVMKRLDPEIEAFKNRTLTHSHFRYLYLDALARRGPRGVQGGLPSPRGQRGQQARNHRLLGVRRRKQRGLADLPSIPTCPWFEPAHSDYFRRSFRP